MNPLIAIMQERLAGLEPTLLDIRDDSAKHAGHEGSRAGGGHYNMTIVSKHFAGKRTLERHRMVYDALGVLMKNEIHALSIETKTPEET